MDFKNFEEIYKEQGIYQLGFQGYRRWWRERNWRDLAGCVQEGWTVLDLASGPGILGDYILERGGWPIGLDNSPAAVRLSEAFEEMVWLGEMTDIPFRDNSFDVVLCSLSLHYLTPSELMECLKEVRRVLRKYGWFAFSYPNIAVRPSADDALELDWGMLEELLAAADFHVAGRTGITPYFPGWLVKLAEGWLSPLLRPYLDRLADRAMDRPDQSYHYAVYCYHE